MDTETHEITASSSRIRIERIQEMRDFVSLLPLDHFTLQSNRIFNVWGEQGVGKSEFVRAIREENAIQYKRVLWIQPKSDESIDTPQEFIAACSNGVRYPKEPDREEAIAKNLDLSQRGKIDPLHSDDAMLITRSSVATNQKPYVNAAAAASVGRTKFVRDDMQVSVGLGSNKSGKQAEAFLDALPLQSMGTDLIILHLPDTDAISLAVKDWFRDYVIPAATKGPFRRNLVVLTETNEPRERNLFDQSFGEWDDLAVNVALWPASETSVVKYATDLGCSPEEAQFVFVKSQGYPAATTQAIEDSKNHRRNPESLQLAATLVSTLPSTQKAKLAACCLPERLYPNELDALFGNGKGMDALTWLASLPGLPLARSEDGRFYTIDEDIRFIAISAVGEDWGFAKFKSKWLPYARLTRAAASKSDRSKLYLVASLNWIEPDICEALFGANKENISQFLDTNPKYFAKRIHRTRISERLRRYLRETASNMGHTGIASLQNKARKLWEERKEQLVQTIEDLERSMVTLDEAMRTLESKRNQLSIQLKGAELEKPPALNAQAIAAAEASNHGKMLALLMGAAALFFIVGSFLDNGAGLAAKVAASIAFGSSLFFAPGWRRQLIAKSIKARAEVKGSPENLRKETVELAQQIQSGENAREELQRNLAEAKEALPYSYV